MKTNLPLLLINDFMLFPGCEVKKEFNDIKIKDILDISESYFNNYVFVSFDNSNIGVVAKILLNLDMPNGYETRFESSSTNICAVQGLNQALKELNQEGIFKHEQVLTEYLVDKLSDISNVILYNSKSKSGILAFNIDGVFAQDTSIYLNNYKICVRAGNHCAKMLKDEIGIKNTVRISMYFYNTKEEVDKLVKVLKNSKDIFKIVI